MIEGRRERMEKDRAAGELKNLKKKVTIVKQYSYYLENSDERMQRWTACVQEQMNKRFEFLKATLEETCKKNWEEIMESFYLSLSAGVKQTLGFIGARQKEKVCYIHFSYLLSSAAAGEMLLKIDFYDNKYFMDTKDINSYWDYQILFPEYAADVERLSEQLYLEVARLAPYELQKAKLYYQACNFMVLEEIIQKLIKTKEAELCIKKCSEPMVSILFGAYQDQAELIHELGGV